MRFSVRFLSPFLFLILAIACLQGTPRPNSFEETITLEDSLVALSPLPRNKKGHIDWVAAIREGIVRPKESLESDATPVPPIKLDIVFRINKALTFPDVMFPHEPHTMWLDCKNCHPSPFVMRQGANPISMDQIVNGEFCGRCHGVVAFPIEDCFRCHSRKDEPSVIEPEPIPLLR